MMGSPWPLCAETEVGIIPHALNDIFAHIAADDVHDYLLRCSYMEIYSESISDLLFVDGNGDPAPSGDMKIVRRVSGSTTTRLVVPYCSSTND